VKVDPAAKGDEVLYVKDRAAWRSWLRRNHRRKRRIWLVFYKKNTSTQSVAYGEALDEALCFGWIDSLIRRIDEERYVRKFTRRNPDSGWSPRNTHRVRELIGNGRMTKAGLTAFKPGNLTRTLPERRHTKRLVIPRTVSRELFAHNLVRERFKALAPSYRRIYVRWILDAKKEETRKRRIAEVVKVVRAGKKLGLK
jgi:uncharacterized protein YdeI (YjbR/CyaY-like superfamily)